MFSSFYIHDVRNLPPTQNSGIHITNEIDFDIEANINPQPVHKQCGKITEEGDLLEITRPAWQDSTPPPK